MLSLEQLLHVLSNNPQILVFLPCTGVPNLKGLLDQGLIICFEPVRNSQQFKWSFCLLSTSSRTVDESFPRIFMVLWRARHPVARARGCLAWQMWIQHADRVEEKKTFDIGISSLPSCGQPRWTWILNASGVRSAEHNQVPEHHLSMSHKCMPWWPKPKYTDMWYVTKLAQSNCRVLCSFHCRLDPEARAPVEEAGPWEIRKVVLSFKKGQPVNRLTFLDLVLTASASSENRIMRCWACCCLHSLVIQGLVPSKTQYLSRCPFSVLLDDTAPTSSNVSTVWQLLWGTLPGLEQSPCLKHCSVQSAHSKAPESVRKASGHQLTSSTNAADFVFWEPNPSKGKRSLVVAVALEHASDLKTSICESWANQKTAWAGSTKADLAVWASKDRWVRRLPGCQADYPATPIRSLWEAMYEMYDVSRLACSAVKSKTREPAQFTHGDWIFSLESTMDCARAWPIISCQGLKHDAHPKVARTAEVLCSWKSNETSEKGWATCCSLTDAAA